MSKDPPCFLQPLDVVVNESLKAARIQEDRTLVFIDVGGQGYVMGGCCGLERQKGTKKHLGNSSTWELHQNFP